MIKFIYLLSAIMVFFHCSNKSQNPELKQSLFGQSYTDSNKRVQSLDSGNIPREVMVYAKNNLPEWKFIDTTGIIEEWQNFIPDVKNPTKVLFDFTNDGMKDFAAILRRKDEARIFIFNNYLNSIQVFELDYYVALYDKVGVGIYLPEKQSEYAQNGFVINKFESSKAFCYWKDDGYALKFKSD